MNALHRRMARLERELADAEAPEVYAVIFQNMAGEVKYQGRPFACLEDARAAAGRPCILVEEVDGRREVSA